MMQLRSLNDNTAVMSSSDDDGYIVVTAPELSGDRITYALSFNYSSLKEAKEAAERLDRYINLQQQNDISVRTKYIEKNKHTTEENEAEKYDYRRKGYKK
ncbi:hypothetical protein [Ruminococcus sp. 210702-SL.1.03]|uniref:hypothetical protein n=1 Tax=Ruminococcus sp. 210702-SL.1.03 TaxID=2883233 RepID=UPI001D084277|nr:hypothetical protein [Ruminococcus sp. 210702-SL.1.03]